MPATGTTLGLGVTVEIKPEAALDLPGGRTLEHSKKKLEAMHPDGSRRRATSRFSELDDASPASCSGSHGAPIGKLRSNG